MLEQLYCFTQGHKANKISHICLYKECQYDRLYCDTCYEKKQHHHKDGFKSMSIKDFTSELNFQEDLMNISLKLAQHQIQQSLQQLDQLTKSINSIVSLIVAEQKRIESILTVTGRVRQLLKRNIKDSILESYQYKEVWEYKHDEQFFEQIQESLQMVENYTIEIDIFHKETTRQYKKKQQQQIIELISQQNHKFYNHFYLDMQIKQMGDIQKSTPKGDYFFIQIDACKLRAFTTFNKNNKAFDEGSVIDVQRYYPNSREHLWNYQITDDCQILITNPKAGVIDKFLFVNKQPVRDQSQVLNCKLINQIFICQPSYLFILVDYSKLWILNLNNLDILIDSNKEQFSGDSQCFFDNQLIAIPIQKSLKFLQYNQIENNSININIDTYTLIDVFKNQRSNVFALSTKQELMATSSQGSHDVQIFQINIKRKTQDLIRVINSELRTLSLYFKFQDQAVIQLTTIRQYYIFYQYQIQNCQFKLFKPEINETIENDNQMHILGDQMDCLIETYKNSVIIAKSIFK